MTEFPTIAPTSACSPHADWSDQQDTPTDSPQPTFTDGAANVFAQASDCTGARAPFLSAFGLGTRHSRCSTPSARNDSGASHDSSFLKPRVKMQRWSDNHPQPADATDVTVEDDTASDKLLTRGLSGSRTPLTATLSDVLNGSDSSQPLIPDIPQWAAVPAACQSAFEESIAVSAGHCTEVLPLARVVSSPQPAVDPLGESLGCGFGSTQSLSSTGGTSMSRCRRKMQSLTCPAFDLGRIEKQQDRDPSFLSEVCNAAEVHPISEISTFLCLGTWKDAGDEALLRRYHIKYVLNVAKELHDEHGTCRPPTPEGNDGEFVSYSIPMRDCHDEKLTKNFNDAFDFIERARRENARVLVHCRRGISRSAAIVVAYLMASEGRTYEDAYTFVRQRRACVSLNLAFQEVLSEYVPDKVWRRHDHSRRLRLDAAPTPVHIQGDDVTDNSSRDSFNDDVMLIDEETRANAAPFSPLLLRPVPVSLCFHGGVAGSPKSVDPKLSSPFSAHTPQHQSAPPISPFA